MPSKSKYVPTYKNLLAANVEGQARPSNKQSRSVNDLISRSRSDRVAKSRAGNSNALSSSWTPVDGLTQSNPLLGDHTVHPAEIARQQAQAKRDASRRVSGPAPPPSWSHSKAHASKHSPPRIPAAAPQRSAAELYLIRELWTRQVLQIALVPPQDSRGVRSLLETTLLTVLDWMTEEGRQRGDGGMQEAITWLDVPMREQLMIVAARHGRGWTLPELRAVCAKQEEDNWAEVLEQERDDSSGDDWDDQDDTSGSFSMNQLDLTGSKHAHRLLFGLFKTPSLAISQLSMTSLNLSCTTLDFSALILVLPVSLRSLALADVTFLDKVTEHNWRMLGQRLQVLLLLDLSYTPISSLSLSFLLNPPTTKLPSLRHLGIRGWVCSESSIRAIVPPTAEERLDPALKAIIRTPERKRWIEILGDGPS